MASQASEVWIHPVGSISVPGLGGMRAYQKELYENLKKLISIIIHKANLNLQLKATQEQTCQKMTGCRERPYSSLFGMK